MAPKRKGRKPHLEVRSRVDGAWYDGDVFFDGTRLRVHFNGFGDDYDEFWDGDCLKNTTRIMGILRLRSKQLQDSQCTKVMVGMVVCANYKTPDGSESKYYDAKVLEIHQSTHGYLKARKAELCKCRFKMAWEDGPDKHKEVVLGCADISLLNSDDIEKHPAAHLLLQAAHDHAEELSARVTEVSDQIPLTEKTDELNQDDILSDDLPPLNRESDDLAKSSLDTEGLPSADVTNVRNVDIFNEFLGKQADQLKEVFDKYDPRMFRHD